MDPRRPHLQAVLVALIACAVPSVAKSAWQIEWVERATVFQELTDRSLTLDSQGRPHLAYGEFSMMHSWFDGTAWTREVVLPVDDGMCATIAVSLDGEVRLACLDQLPEVVLCGRRTSEGWVVETVDSGQNVGGCTSMALDALGHAHLSYRGGFLMGDLIHAWETDRGWLTETVDHAGAIVENSAIALDPSGYPHIAYQTSSPELRQLYAGKDAAGWHLETLASGPWLGDLGTTIACDQNAYPHLCYVFGSSGNLLYEYQDAAGWHTEVVESGAAPLSRPSIALDSQGKPRLSYLAGEDGDLKYAAGEVSGWSSELVIGGLGSSGGSFTALALDAADDAYIGCVDAGSLELLCIHQSGGAWQAEVADYGGIVGWHSSLALSGGQPGISYTQLNSRDLRYAWYDESGWHTETVDPQGGGWTSLRRDTEGHPQISFYDYRNAALRYAWQDDAGWHTEVVDSQPGAGRWSSLALDRLGEARVSYTVGEDLCALYYAHRTGTTWQTELVDGDGDAGRYASLALDESGYPHIGYYSETDAQLRYCYQDASGWHYEVADSDGQPGRCASLALAGSTAHISYQEYVGRDLRYAWRDAAGWHVEAVESEGQTGYDTSLVVDAAGFPRISYLADSGRAVRYAWKDAGGWHYETVYDHSWPYGSGTSLVLDEAGCTVLSYCEGTTGGGLRCARQIPVSLTPTTTATPTATPTSSPTLTETQSAMATLTPPATRTASPTSTRTPTGSYTATASVTASSTSALIQVLLTMPAQRFAEGDICSLEVRLDNAGSEKPADLYVLLDVFGEYWSYPSWQPLDLGLDYETVAVPAGSSTRSLIAAFTMPAVQPCGPLFFYAALFEPGYLDFDHLLSNGETCFFWLGE